MRNRNIFYIFLLALALIHSPVLAYGDSEIRINVPSRTLQLIKAGKLVKEYSVGVGSSKANMTPPGIYAIDKKVINPIWEHPYKSPGESRVGSGANNPLGTRWIGFHAKGSGVYGIHGTNQPNSIGHFVSHGCVRMHNADVEELFELIEINTPVKVDYNRYRLYQVGNTISLEVFPDPYGYKPLNASEIIQEIRKKDPFAQIDNELLEKAIKDTSEQAIYEVALQTTSNVQMPAFTDPLYSQPTYQQPESQIYYAPSYYQYSQFPPNYYYGNYY